jgi:uncharacterized protein (TIGR03437 family)
MKQIIRLSIFMAILLISIHTTESYVQIRTNAGAPVAWNLTNPTTPIVSNGRVTYRLDTAGSDDLPFFEVDQAIDRSFQSWENVPSSTIAFTKGPGFTSNKTNLPDAFDIFWLEDTTIIDDDDISGALAVSFVGSVNGEIVDLFVVFNGNQATWATDGSPGAFDIQQVATHEIGHCIGLDHSPNAASTMFPRTGDGSIQARSLSPDDQIAASVIYPSPDFSSSTGTINGRVQDSVATTPIFGAHVVAVDTNGIAVAGALSEPDGTYTIQGLPPGSYSIYAQPIGSDERSFFRQDNLSPFYDNGINTNFRTSPDFTVVVNAGATSTFDIGVAPGPPTLEHYAVLEPGGNVFFTIGSTLVQGQFNVAIGVAGRGLPLSGTPLSVSGPGITITQTLFGLTTPSNFPYIISIVSVDSTAPLGPRNIVIANGIHRTIVTGGIEIVPNPNQLAPSVTSILSQADYSARVAPESLAVAFGTNLAFSSVVASTNPLPTSLGGTSVAIRDSAGAIRPASLSFVAPGQINFQIPPGTQPGSGSIVVRNETGSTYVAPLEIQGVSPALFTVDGNINGAPYGFLFRIRANGTAVYEQITRFDATLGRVVLIPIDPGPPTDRLILGLFGTGFRFRSALPSVTVGGVVCPVTFAGATGSIGIDQVNIELDRSLSGRGTVDVAMNVDGEQANTVMVSIGGTIPVTPTVTGILSQADYSPRVAPESLAVAFGSDLANATAAASTNPAPTSLAGTTVAILDSAGTTRLAPLSYASPGQINFQIPSGTRPGAASITFRNGTNGALTMPIEIQSVAPSLYTLDGNVNGIPYGFVFRIRANGTSVYEPISRFDPALGRVVAVPINLGPSTDQVILGLYGTGIRFRNDLPTAVVGGATCQVTFAGATGLPGVDQTNIVLPQSIAGSGPVNVNLTVDGNPANAVSVIIH